MKRSRLYFGLLLFAVSAFLLGQAAPNGCISPVMIAPQGEGSGLDSDMVDGKHSWELLGGSGGCLHVIDAEENDIGIYLGSSNVGGNQIFVPSLGLSFTFNTWTGELSNSDVTWSKLYESIDCTGDFYAWAFSPYSSFSFTTGDSGVYAVTAVGNRTIRSAGYNGECHTEGGPWEQQVAISFKTVTVPSFPAPLRLEAR